MECADVVIIGAGKLNLISSALLISILLRDAYNLGWNGLCVAKTYLQCDSTAKILVLDDQPTIGGVWAEHRLYPGLKTNNMRGNYEFGDFTFDEAGLDVKHGEHILGQSVYDYLHAYARHFGIYQAIRFNTKVLSAEQLDGGQWLLSIVDTNSTKNATAIIHTKKLVVATGLTSDAFVPTFAGRANFQAPIFHVKELLERSETLLKTAQNVTILGGTKSAWDAAYAYASAGIKVDWVIRESGHGPVWMSPAYFNRKWNMLLERMVHVRMFTWFSPCIWGPADGYGWVRQRLHGSSLGRWIVRRFWAFMQGRLVHTNKYDEHEQVGKLKPWVDMFWIAGSLSILNYKTDFFELVRSGMIQIHIADIKELDGNSVFLSNKKELKSDALICSTGWRHRPSIQFLPEGIDAKLGLPYQGPPENADMIAQANKELFRRFPTLEKQPRLNPRYKPMKGVATMETLSEPYRLFHFIAPPLLFEERSLAFAGVVQSISTVYIAQAQGLWIAAFFQGKLPIQSETIDTIDRISKLKWETALHTQYGRWRCPGGYGSRFPDFVYDGLPYVDLLLKDLDLNPRRKKSLWQDLTQPYLTYDYRDIVDEWKIKNPINKR
jgi:cation diffusion facilitator CzcD-associated flavoprotein CzcO